MLNPRKSDHPMLILFHNDPEQPEEVAWIDKLIALADELLALDCSGAPPTLQPEVSED